MSGARAAWLPVLLGVLAAPSAALAQEPPLPFLLTLPDKYAMVRYVPDTLDRSVHLQERFKLLTHEFNRWSGTPTEMIIYVLEREDWENAGLPRPYGLPLRVGFRALAVAARGDSGSVAMWTELLGHEPPPLPGVPLRGTAVQVAGLALTDVLAQTEAARLLLSRAGVAGDAPWVTELVAHLVAVATFARYEPHRIEELRQFYRDLGRAALQGTPDLRTYRPDVTLAEWSRYQGQFFEAALSMVEPNGKTPVKQVLRQAKKSGGAIRAMDLLQKNPELAGWFRGQAGG